MARIIDEVTVNYTHVELSERDRATVRDALFLACAVANDEAFHPDFDHAEYRRVLKELMLDGR